MYKECEMDWYDYFLFIGGCIFVLFIFIFYPVIAATRSLDHYETKKRQISFCCLFSVGYLSIMAMSILPQIKVLSGITSVVVLTSLIAYLVNGIIFYFFALKN